jgi:hypothetical protein
LGAFQEKLEVPDYTDYHTITQIKNILKFEKIGGIIFWPASAPQAPAYFV